MPTLFVLKMSLCFFPQAGKQGFKHILQRRLKRNAQTREIVGVMEEGEDLNFVNREMAGNTSEILQT